MNSYNGNKFLYQCIMKNELSLLVALMILECKQIVNGVHQNVLLQKKVLLDLFKILCKPINGSI